MRLCNISMRLCNILWASDYVYGVQEEKSRSF
jgi:hypothetical protein